MININYGKLIGGNLEYLKLPLKTIEGDTWTNDGQTLLNYGYKPIIYTDAPQQEGYYANPTWHEELSEIVQQWELLPMPEIEAPIL